MTSMRPGFLSWSCRMYLISSPRKQCLPCSLSRDISFELQRCRMMEALRQNQPVCFLPFFHHARVLGRGSDILKTLDEGGCTVAGCMVANQHPCLTALMPI